MEIQIAEDLQPHRTTLAGTIKLPVAAYLGASSSTGVKTNP
jgi:hypothetical protein